MKILNLDKAFIDVQYSLETEYQSNTDSSIIILGGHLYADKGATIQGLKRRYNVSKAIVFNLEQLSNTCPWLTPAYKRFLATADDVFDYDEANIEYLRNSGIRRNAIHHLISPVSKHFPIYKMPKHPIDVFFYGCMNPRRQLIIDTLQKCGLKVAIGNGYYGDDLVPFLSMSKVLLNVHFYELALQEQARMIRWMAAPYKIVSETSRKNYLGITEVPYNKIVETVINKVQNFTDG